MKQIRTFTQLNEELKINKYIFVYASWSFKSYAELGQTRMGQCGG